MTYEEFLRKLPCAIAPSKQRKRMSRCSGPADGVGVLRFCWLHANDWRSGQGPFRGWGEFKRAMWVDDVEARAEAEWERIQLSERSEAK